MLPHLSVYRYLGADAHSVVAILAHLPSVLLESRERREEIDN
jgi:hypothetical protein